MIKVDEVYPIDINSTIGPTGTIKRLFRHRDYFRQRGYELTIFANHPVKKRLLTYKYELRKVNSLSGDADSGIMKDTINSDSKKSYIKSRLKSFIESNQLTSAIMLFKREKSNRKTIQNYLSFDRDTDIVVFHEFESCYNYYSLLGGVSKAKTALFIHADGSDDAMFSKSHPKLVNTVTHKRVMRHLQYAISQCDCVVFISNLARQKFCANHPDCAHKAITILNGIENFDLKKVNHNSGFHFRLVSTGTVSNRKGQYIVVEAMHRMIPEVLDDTHFTIIGTGPDHSRLVSLVNTYDLNGHVSFEGNVPNSEIHNRLSEENIYILMSNNEGLPISILEAMRAGLPVISTNVSGIPEEVDERNGILINPDIEQLTNVLNKLPKYNWTALGEASRQRFEKEFTFDIMRKKYADMFDSLLNRL